MTNKELQEKLKEFPDDLEVMMYDYEYTDHNHIDRVIIEKVNDKDVIELG